MTYRTTLGWSLIASGFLTILIGLLPLGDLFWGIVLILVGTGVLLVRN